MQVSSCYAVTCILFTVYVDLLYFKQGADVGIDIIITRRIVDFGIDQVGETAYSINDNLPIVLCAN